MVLVYGPLGGCCNYTPVAPLSTSSEVCGTAAAERQNGSSRLPGEFPAVLCRSRFEP